MNFRPHRLAAAMALACLLAGPAAAQTGAAMDATTRNLIALLVQNGVLTAEQADALLEQARRDSAAEAAAAAPAAEPGDVRVTWIPENVRRDMTEEVRQQVVAQAREENWAQPNTFPDWARRIRLEADLRLRSESRFFGDHNSPYFIDFQRFNDQGPQDISALALAVDAWPPLYNTTEDRNLLRLRARFGLQADLSERWDVGLRVATGSGDDPVSTNQTLGGGLEKKDLWLDRGFLRWRATSSLAFIGGRFGNPFWSGDMLFSNDLNFDGVAVQYLPEMTSGWSWFGTLGAFPLEFTDDSSPSRSEYKTRNQDKWLFATQLGLAWKGDQGDQWRAALAYYEFDNISGELSDPCRPWYNGREAGHGCNTDWSRPAFAQKGNTMFALRNIMLDPLDPATTPMPQYVGLASEFSLLNLSLRYQTPLFNDLHLRVDGQYLRNLAYSEGDMLRRSGARASGTVQDRVVNNVQGERIDSGDTAWMVDLTLGPAMELTRPGQWNLQLGYKYIEADALPDAYNDATFHRGGTNAKGYWLGGAYSFHERVYGQLRWMSSEEVSGAPLSVDILQVELNARF